MNVWRSTFDVQACFEETDHMFYISSSTSRERRLEHRGWHDIKSRRSLNSRNDSAIQHILSCNPCTDVVSSGRRQLWLLVNAKWKKN